MRSTFAGLNTMVSGIQTYTLGLDTVGHNITNAGSKGYSRQTIDPAAVAASRVYTYYGASYVGNGTASQAIYRARDIYADKQYWRESSTKGYYDTMLTNYQKVEEIFNDSTDNGLQNAITDFYKSWVDLSTNASITSYRTAVIEKGKILAEKIKLNTTQIQNQIYAEYEDLKINVDRVNTITDTIVQLNKAILAREASGAKANDLRDARDLLVDELAEYMNINLYEDAEGMYTVVSNGCSIVNGISNLHLELANRVDNPVYGVADYTLQIKETATFFDGLEGILRGNLENIAHDKGFIDDLANMAAFLLTTLNDQHKIGEGIDNGPTLPGTTGKNFYGDDKATYTWEEISPGSGKYALQSTGGLSPGLYQGVLIIGELFVNPEISKAGGEKLVAARTAGNGTADGENATWISTLFNMEQNNTHLMFATSVRSIGTISLNSYYNNSMTALGINTEMCLDNLEYEEGILEQIMNWRESTQGVNWNEELTIMIMYQQGWSACSRCLTTMDEMLDRLVNQTGVVGR